MQIIISKNFVKKYTKLQEYEKKSFKERRDIFLENPYDPILNNHALHGKYGGYRSINIKGDLRVVYKFIENNLVIFAEIGSHGQLY